MLKVRGKSILSKVALNYVFQRLNMNFAFKNKINTWTANNMKITMYAHLSIAAFERNFSVNEVVQAVQYSKQHHK